jgi:hypothetical protein
LDDLTVTVEELQDELPWESEGEPLKTIKTALEQASEATDELETAGQSARALILPMGTQMGIGDESRTRRWRRAGR